MFSPIGKKKILLQIKRAKESGHEDPLGVVMSRMGQGSPSKDSEGGSEMGSPGQTKARSKRAEGPGISTAKIDTLIADKGMEGHVMKKLMEATTRYNPETDRITLKLFQNNAIGNTLFRDILNKAFWLTFTDIEYRTLLEIFDPRDNGVIDGYQFIIAFIRLGAIRKDRAAEATRLSQVAFEEKCQEEELKKKLELEKKNDIAADFDFDSSVHDEAMKKLNAASKKFDPARAPSLQAFNGKFMSAAVLREMLKRVFNLKVTSKELGAILKHFEDSDVQDAAAAGSKVNSDTMLKSIVGDVDGNIGREGEVTVNNNNADVAAQAAVAAFTHSDAPAGPNQISCNNFLRRFFRLGIDARHRAAKEQRTKQAQLIKVAEEGHAAKLKNAEEKMTLSVNYDFNEVDIARADQKLLNCSTSYDRNAPGCQSLDGFECESLSAGAFSDLVRRTFGLKLSGKELGYVIRKYDKTGLGNITCKSFIKAFLRMGQEERDRLRLKQLEKQRRMDELSVKENEQKIKAIQEGSSNFKVDYDFKEADMDSATEKLTEASIWFDKSRGGSLASFETKTLSPLDFHRALFRTFNLKLSPAEIGAVITNLHKDGQEKGHIVSKEFINSFMALGFSARANKNIEQLKSSKEAEKKMIIENEKKREELLNKSDIAIEYNVTEKERENALIKMGQAALKYDKSHPAAKSLEGFTCKELTPVAFYGLVRRTFDLRLSPKDCGALVTHFDTSGTKMVNCQEFLTVFLQLGYQQRGQLAVAQLEKQRKEDKERAERDAEMLEKMANRSGSLKINMDFAESDAVSAQSKLLTSAEGYDKNHPAAPSLDAFDIAFMTPGIFRENMKRCFGIKLNPSELGYCVATYGDKKDMKIRSPAFLTTFLRQGKAARYEKQTAALVKQRRLIKEAKEREEAVLKAQSEGAEFKVDLNDFADSDLESALGKMQLASSKFHEHTSTLTGFTGGPMKPGEFRELVRRSFGLALTPKETAALIAEFPFKPDDPKMNPGELDSKKFLIKFMKLGHDARNALKNAAMENQRRAEAFAEKEKIRKKRIADQKITTDIDWDYGEVDRTSIYQKLTASSAKYDKNAPGCVSLVAFDALYLTPVVFKEVMKATVGIYITPKELAVLISDFDDNHGNLHCQNFLVAFIQLGAAERQKFKMVQLEKQARDNQRRKTEHERKMREAEEKMSLKVSYDFSTDEKVEAFKKLAAAAKRYDKNAPGCMSLDGFEQKVLPAGVFREMIKRTFGLIPTVGELGAIMSYFDKEKTGMVPSQEFIVHFLKVGAAERNKDKTAALKKIRNDAIEREKVQADLLAAAWKKTEISVDQKWDDKDRDSAMLKLEEAAFKYDPSSAGPMGPIAFQAKFLTASVFKDMLKRTFGMKITDNELACLITQFEHEDEPQCINCKTFMVEFNKLGINARRDKTIGNVVKNRIAQSEQKAEHELILHKAEEKMASVVDMKYAKQDFNSALEKIRTIAGNYERGHASSPSLSGFRGANMKPYEFKDMLMRTFSLQINAKELGALTKFFDTSGSQCIDSAEFLAHFAKVNRQESEIKRKKHIEKEKKLRTAATIKENEYQAQKAREQVEKTKFDKEDEISFMKKIRTAAESYAVDSAAMQDPLQAFKGPALNAISFIDIFRRVFHGIKLTFKEYGVLLSILDTIGTGCIDGPKFLNWFYKLGRAETLIMLGEAEDDITLAKLRAGATIDVTVGASSIDALLKPFNGKSPEKTGDKRKKHLSKSASVNSTIGFNNQTLDKGWVLPAAANEDIDIDFNEGGRPDTNQSDSTKRGNGNVSTRESDFRGASRSGGMGDGMGTLDGGDSLTLNGNGSVMTANGNGGSLVSNTSRGGKKLALLLLSEEGYKVGAQSNQYVQSINMNDSLDGSSAVFVPSMPGGISNSTRSVNKVSTGKKKKIGNKQLHRSDIDKANNEMNEVNKAYSNYNSHNIHEPGRSIVATKEIHVEKNPYNGKTNIAVQAAGPHAANQAGFFFPVLLRQSLSSNSNSNSNENNVLNMPDIGISGLIDHTSGGSNHDFF